MPIFGKQGPSVLQQVMNLAGVSDILVILELLADLEGFNTPKGATVNP